MNEHPHCLKKVDVGRANISQLIPYMSKDFDDYKQLYDNLAAAFKDLFVWIEDMVSRIHFSIHLSLTKQIQLHQKLPIECEAIASIVDSLPGQPGSLVSPFVSFVLNINVRTQGHRDVGDKHMCLVLALGEFQGGGLVLKEPGIVIQLGNGDLAVFQSHSTTHFNLDYTGKRASFVFQTDRAFDQWIDGENGWSSNNHYH